MLIRRCVSPILFVKEDRKWKSGVILAAVNFEAADEEHERLNSAVIQRAKTLAQLTGMKVKLVSAITPNVNYSLFAEELDINKMSKEEVLGNFFGVDPEDIILKEGAPKDVIVSASEETDADVVVIGTIGRKGISGALIGNTAEKILDQLVADVLVVT